MLGSALKTWILIADGGRARIVEKTGLDFGVREVAGQEFASALPMSRDIGDDKPGRSFDSTGSHRHAMEGHTDPHRQLKREFAAELANHLEEKRASGAFDRLIVVAPAPMMGDLRPLWSDDIRTRILAEIVSDLTKVPNSEIGAHLSRLIQG